MYKSKILLSACSNRKPSLFTLFRNIHAVQVLNQNLPPQGYTAVMDRSLFFTNLPKKKREKKVKVKLGNIPYGSLIIKCKNKMLNHYSGMHYGKFDVIPLASKSWHNRKSKGDYFTILPSKQHPAFTTKEDLPETFEENGVSEELIQQLKSINVSHPTVIQAKSIRSLLSGENVFISSECGSGKTLAYLIAVIESVHKLKDVVNNDNNSPLAIILVPTKELALQIGHLAHTLSSKLGVICQTLTGGDINALLKCPKSSLVHILICTPLVIKKHLQANIYSAAFCKHLIIDEADTLLEEDFHQQMREFSAASKLKFVPFSEAVQKFCSQICFVSATSPSDIETRLLEIMKGADLKTISTSHVHKVVSHVPQLFKRIGKLQRAEELLKIVKSAAKRRIPTMIFSNQKGTSTWVSHFLSENGVNCPKLNQSDDSGDRFQHFRDFQQGSVDFISCTDLGSRGLHFERAKHVINFEFPRFLADYIHRCGRVGRLGQGNDCMIINFISSRFEVPLLNKIETAVRTNSPLTGVRSDREYQRTSFKPNRRRR